MRYRMPREFLVNNKSNDDNGGHLTKPPGLPSQGCDYKGQRYVSFSEAHDDDRQLVSAIALFLYDKHPRYHQSSVDRAISERAIRVQRRGSTLSRSQNVEIRITARDHRTCVVSLPLTTELQIFGHLSAALNAFQKNGKPSSLA